MGERARIARELHDVVAHHISMIAVEADTARLATPGMPAEGERHLLVDPLDRARRDERDAARARRAARRRRRRRRARAAARARPARTSCSTPRATPAPRCGWWSTAGSRRCPPGVDLAAYRIVQEALTNARRHAPGRRGRGRARLRRATRCGCACATTGPGRPGAGGGHGLLGHARARRRGRRQAPDRPGARRAASWSRRSCRYDDPRRRGRRPADRPRGLRGAAGDAGGHHRRRQRRRRRGGDPGLRRAAARRRADGRPHAGARRHRGDAPARGRDEGDHPHDLRPRRATSTTR